MVPGRPIWPSPASSAAVSRRAPPVSGETAAPAAGRRRIANQWSRLKGPIPLGSVHGGPMDQVHRAGPRPRVILASATTSHGPPRGTPSAPPSAAFAVLQKEPPVSGIHNHALPPYEIAPGFFGLNPRFSKLSNCDNPPSKIPYYHLRPIHFGH
jgi:hypothetical protein